MLTAEHVALARAAARRFSIRLPASISVDDLTQVALIALWKWIPRFDTSLGISQDAFLRTKMRGAMLDELRAHDHLGRDARQRDRAINSTTRRLEHELGRRPRMGEVAAAMGMSLASLASHYAEMQPPEPDDVDVVDPSAVVEAAQMAATVHAVLAEMTERNRRFVECRFDGGGPVVAEADRAGISAGRVSQIGIAGIEKLRAALST